MTEIQLQKYTPVHYDKQRALTFLQATINSNGYPLSLRIDNLTDGTAGEDLDMICDAVLGGYDDYVEYGPRMSHKTRDKELSRITRLIDCLTGDDTRMESEDSSTEIEIYKNTLGMNRAFKPKKLEELEGRGRNHLLNSIESVENITSIEDSIFSLLESDVFSENQARAMLFFFRLRESSVEPSEKVRKAKALVIEGVARELREKLRSFVYTAAQNNDRRVNDLIEGAKYLRSLTEKDVMVRRPIAYIYRNVAVTEKLDEATSRTIVEDRIGYLLKRMYDRSNSPT